MAILNIGTTDNDGTGDTLRDAFRKINNIAAVISRTATVPASPTQYDFYIVSPSPTGDWAGQENNFAWYNGTSWEFYTPSEGDRVWVRDTRQLAVFSASVWTIFESGSGGGGGGGGGDPLGYAKWTPPTNMFTPARDPATVNAFLAAKPSWMIRHVGQQGVSAAVTSEGITAGADFDKIFTLRGIVSNDAFATIGVFAGDSTSNQQTSMTLDYAGGYIVQFWNNYVFEANGASTAAFQMGARPTSAATFYARIQRTGANLIFYTSLNGIDWFQFATVPVASSGMTDVDQVGLLCTSAQVAGGVVTEIECIGYDEGPQDELETGSGGGVAATELMTNGDFEVGDATGWTEDSGSMAVVALGSETAASGFSAAEIQAGTYLLEGGIQASGSFHQEFAISADRLALRGVIRTNDTGAADSITVTFEFRDASGNVCQSYAFTQTGNDGTEYINQVVSRPLNATRMRVRIDLTRGATGSFINAYCGYLSVTTA